MALAIAQNQANRVNQLGNFRELSVGAGSSIFKMVNPWVWGGGNNPTSATFKIYLPSGALTTTGTVNASGGTITGDMSVSGILTLGSVSGLQVKLRGDLGTVDFLYNNSRVGYLVGISSGDMALTSDKNLYLTAGDNKQFMIVGAAETGVSPGDVWMRVSGSKIYWSSERYIQDDSSGIKINGDLTITGTYYSDGESGYTGDQEYKDHDGNDRTATFVGGICTGI